MKQLYTLATAATLYTVFCWSISPKFGSDFISYISDK